MPNRVDPDPGRAVRNASTLTRLRRELDALRRGIDELGQAMIVLTEANRVSAITPRAARLVTTYVGPVRRDRLPGAMERWLVTGHDGASAPLLVKRSGKYLVARLVSHPGQRLLLLDEHSGQSVDPRSLGILGLSRRECEVLAWVAEGKTNGEIATILGTSPRTVDKHLEHVFRKLGVETRTGAMARALAGRSPAA